MGRDRDTSYRAQGAPSTRNGPTKMSVVLRSRKRGVPRVQSPSRVVLWGQCVMVAEVSDTDMTICGQEPPELNTPVRASGKLH